MKALATTTIEKVLSNIGTPVLDKVEKRLYKEYHCYIPDCYDHPEYLESVLKSLYGKAHMAIVDQIREELLEQMSDKGIRKLVTTIGS